MLLQRGARHRTDGCRAVCRLKTSTTRYLNFYRFQHSWHFSPSSRSFVREGRGVRVDSHEKSYGWTRTCFCWMGCRFMSHERPSNSRMLICALAPKQTTDGTRITPLPFLLFKEGVGWWFASLRRRGFKGGFPCAGRHEKASAQMSEEAFSYTGWVLVRRNSFSMKRRLFVAAAQSQSEQ